MRMLSCFVILLFCSCVGDERIVTEQCSVVENEDGTATIKCPDGTEAQISPQVRLQQAADAGSVETDAAQLDAFVADSTAGDTFVVDVEVIDVFTLDVDSRPDVSEADTTDFPDVVQHDSFSEDLLYLDDATVDDVFIEDVGMEDAEPEQKIMYGDYIIQNSIDLENLFGYTEVVGDLHIWRGVPSLAGLESLQVVHGQLEIFVSDLSDLQGLNNLHTVGSLTLQRSGSNQLDGISSLNGLESLTYIGGLQIQNTNIQSVYIPELSAINGVMLWIVNNPLLPHCKILELLEQVEGRDGIEVEQQQIRGNYNPCDDTELCPGGICTEDCTNPEYYSCL